MLIFKKAKKQAKGKFCKFAINRDHSSKSKETRMVTYTPVDILVGILSL